MQRECWDTMAEHLTVVEGVHSDTEVNNYPLPHNTPEEEAFIQRIITMRRVELYNFANLKS